MFRKTLLVADTVLATLLVVSLIGLIQVYIFDANERADVLIFASVLGVPYALLRFVTLGNPMPYTVLPSKDAKSP